MTLLSLIAQLKRAKIALLGDFMLDVYVMGRVSRISPEAPVPILHVQREEEYLGGAGNAFLNLQALGAEVLPIGRVGSDWAGWKVLQLIDSKRFTKDTAYVTPLKRRMVAESQQLLRVDCEDPQPLSKELEEEVIRALPEWLEGVAAVALSDYGKGFLTPKILEAIFAWARARAIPTLVDPKGRDFSRYRGATVIKPNLSEALAASGLPAQAPLGQHAARLLEQTESDYLLITRAQEGSSLFARGGQQSHFPAHVREIRDVTGAGDTVFAVIAMALANGCFLAGAAKLANVAAGIAIERFGCVRVSLTDLVKRLSLLEPEQKILRGLAGEMVAELVGRRRVVELEALQEVSLGLFEAIRRSAEEGGKAIVAVFDETSSNPLALRLLASLQEVEWILINPVPVPDYHSLLISKEV